MAKDALLITINEDTFWEMISTPAGNPSTPSVDNLAHELTAVMQAKVLEHPRCVCLTDADWKKLSNFPGLKRRRRELVAEQIVDVDPLRVHKGGSKLLSSLLTTIIDQATQANGHRILTTCRLALQRDGFMLKAEIRVPYYEMLANQF